MPRASGLGLWHGPLIHTFLPQHYREHSLRSGGKRGSAVRSKTRKKKTDTFTASLWDEADYFHVQSTIKCGRGYLSPAREQSHVLSHCPDGQEALINRRDEMVWLGSSRKLLWYSQRLNLLRDFDWSLQKHPGVISDATQWGTRGWMHWYDIQ